ncbi:hypothetical protein [Bacillus sp. B-jedd]|uniref:hypothetical protein n=1 Tax=Bacillus sp. B-jedd TaxID=1476857 RepID=UPI0005155F5B|nr:hypothetical protein [Bacillus sp. B-jedd]CEG26278.1 hypothetical protein BN1002_01120 [Bacillus sp. B-jedd]
MKNKKLQPYLVTAIVLIGLYFAGSYLLDKFFGDLCGNDIIQKVPSPNGNKIAFIFQRDCGASTGSSYQLSLLDSDEELPNESGNAFVSDHQFQVTWLTIDKLRVNYKKSSEIFEMDKRVGRTSIEYIGN